MRSTHNFYREQMNRTRIWNRIVYIGKIRNHIRTD
jgi:hypothetical protein